PTGLSMLKTLTEDGFAVTLYERRSQVGGLWAYTDNSSWTTALKSNVKSKYTCGFSDFPMPDKNSSHMNVFEWQKYMEDYACHFDVLKHCVFNTSVHKVHRNADDMRWALELDAIENKRVVVLGLCGTSGDIIPTLMPVASRVWVSHRRGSVFPHYNKVWERVLPFLQHGSLTLLKGLTKFVGRKSIQFADGTVLEDVDVVILVTGYEADFSLLSPDIVERSRIKLEWYQGPDIYRLWMNLFPSRWADSVAVLNYSTFEEQTGSASLT
ncbi:hypothetical protein N7495_003092, partial [Penicillium taxi]|uniref:uncharacterized protein n=1 Tax=Penicillium taxi TaxID=168475 RepID=UPI002545643D